MGTVWMEKQRFRRVGESFRFNRKRFGSVEIFSGTGKLVQKFCAKTLGTFCRPYFHPFPAILVHSRSFPFYSRSFPFIPVLFSSIPVHSRSILVPFSAARAPAVYARRPFTHADADARQLIPAHPRARRPHGSPRPHPDPSHAPRSAPLALGSMRERGFLPGPSLPPPAAPPPARTPTASRTHAENGTRRTGDAPRIERE